MSRTYRQKPRKTFRRLGGRKQAIINDARPGAVPPDAWDDICASDECWLPMRVAIKMYGRFEKTEAIRRLVKKFKLTYVEAEQIITSEWWYLRKRLKL